MLTAWVLTIVVAFAPGPSMITVSGISSEKACHELAAKMEVKSYKCFPYAMRGPVTEMGVSP